MLTPGHIVLLVSPKGKRYFKVPVPGGILNTHDGTLALDDVLQAGIGGKVTTHLGREYTILRPTLYDLIKNIKRQTQIIYPKDIGYLVIKLGIGPGSRVIEAGSGSGSLTTALAWFVGNEGKVYTYERREEFSELCGQNLAWAGLEHRVERFQGDISDGFRQTDIDALFLDVRTPWDYLEQAARALAPGAPIGFLLPTTNQVSELLRRMETSLFGQVEVMEILTRRYKPVADRLRPDDRMVAHTGFLVFARLETTRQQTKDNFSSKKKQKNEEQARVKNMLFQIDNG